MKATLLVISLVAIATAVPDPLITQQPELAPRADPALLGWVAATNGQCECAHLHGTVNYAAWHDAFNS